ncbi:MAG: PHP domain-containing protein [Bacillota bacterium]
MSKVDFHLHSSASDGLFTPRRVMEIAASADLSAAGLTDHDTVSGLAEAEEAAGEMGLELIPGIEISVYENNREIHLLGYYPKKIKELSVALEDIRSKRFRRMALIVDNLQALGFKLKPEEVIAEAGGAAPGRLHLARLLVKKKYVHTIAEAFKTYLNRGKPAFVSRESMSAPEVLDLLHRVEAVSVIAHPGNEGKEILDQLVSFGLQGIEVYHPDHNKKLIDYFNDYAEAKGLLITGGSDFHGQGINCPGYQRQYALSYKYLQAMKDGIEGS